MDDPRLDIDAPEATAWVRALTLDERRALAVAPADVGRERGAERFGRWRAEQGFSEQFLERRLASGGFDEAHWHAALGEPEEALRARVLASGARPAWLTGLLADLGSAPALDATAEHPWNDAPPNARFLTLVEPLLAHGAARLLARVESEGGVGELQLTQLLEPIRTRLLTLIERTMILEMHIAGLTGELTQEDPSERYDAFIERIDDPDVRVTTLQTYPVLARAAWSYIDQWVRNAGDLVAALSADGGALVDVFGELGAAVSVRAVDSDPHRDGRHVWFVDFAGGARLVYKPRPCRAEAAFQEYVQELNAEGLEPQLREIKVLARAAYGWLEYIEIDSVATSDAAQEFHRRQGAWLPVLWTLACNDMHYENIRASGAHPVPIDHETVMRNRLARAPHDDLLYQLDDVRGDSVAAIGLLPSPLWDDGFGGYIDQAGMGVGYDDAGTVMAPSVVGSGSEMRVEAAIINPERQHNRAEFDGELLDPRAFVEAIEEGFTRAWDHLAARAETADARLARFDDATVRMVLRPTQNYLHLLDVLAHPEYLQDALERERAILQLWMYPDSQDWRDRIVESERRQLLAGDVPWFGSVVSSTDVLAGDETVVEDAIAVLGRDVARERFAAMDADRFADELWAVRAALSKRNVGSSVALAVQDRSASGIADELVRDIHERSIQAGEMRSWFVLNHIGAGEGDNMRFVADAAAQDLYSGLPGIALTLAAHHQVTGSQRSHDAVREVIAAIRGHQTPLVGIGAYDGAAGLIWTYLQLAEWLDDAFLLDHAEAAARFIEGGLDGDRQFDIISGAAGCIPVLLELERVRPGALDLAMRCGNHLLDHVTTIQDLPFQRGFSHGGSGVAWALIRLSRVTGEPRWEERARELLAEEDAAIGEEWWADHEDNPHFAAWCHGAPGIALARADILRMSGDAGDGRVLDAAVSAACAAERQDSHGVCHGELGNIDALFDVADLLDRDDVRAEAQRRLQDTLLEMQRVGVRSTGPRHIPTPGMMLGTGGIAWSLMRSDAPDRIPSILLPGSVVRTR